MVMAMGDKSKIEWTDATWNPVTGCTKVSQGCKFCYAERQFPRVYGRDEVLPTVPVSTLENYRTEGLLRYRKFTDVKCLPDRLDQPLHWKRPRMIFVNSMSDLFHEDVPDEFIARVFAVMFMARWHTFQILTKRPQRMREFCIYNQGYVRDALRSMGASDFDHEILNCYWPGPNVWLGVSVEDQQTANERIPLLLQTPAAVRWVSAEPLLAPVDFTGPLYAEGQAGRPGISSLDAREMWMPRLDWIVCGGESGPSARPMHPDWARSIRDQCKSAGVPFFFKQWGEWAPAHTWHQLDGGVWMHCSGEIFSPVKGEPFRPAPLSTHMIRYGKKRSGAFLDGVEHKEYPEVHHG